MTRAAIYQAIDQERDRQDKKHPVFAHDYHEACTVLMEEAGEVARAVLELKAASRAEKLTKEHYRRLRAELVQNAAVCVRWLEEDMDV